MKIETTKIEQTTSHVLMVRPSNFGFNWDTADNNSFQKNDQRFSRQEIIKEARKEFDALVNMLLNAGIHVLVHQEKDGAVSTDAVFPNNWFSCHQDGSLITYPMFSERRRTERESTIILELSNTYKIKKHLKLEPWEQKERFLEGTGSMVLDRQYKIAYACRSNRTDESVLDEFCETMGYTKFLFDAIDRNGLPIYHTNVMMAAGSSFVVICLESIKHKEQRERLRKSFDKTQKEIIEISWGQMEQFAGNMIQVKNENDHPFLVMSTAAFDSLTRAQRTKMEGHSHLLHSDLRIIETYGGGSARCMIAEVFLPRK